MKRITLSIIMLAMAFIASAQDGLRVFNRDFDGKYSLRTSSMIQTSDGCAITNVEMYNAACGGEYAGTCLYKVNSDGHAVDSVFLSAPLYVSCYNAACFRHPTIEDATVFTSGNNINDTIFFRMLTVSDDLEVISDRLVPLYTPGPVGPYVLVHGTLDTEGNIVTSIESYGSCKEKSRTVIVAKLNPEGEVLAGPVELGQVYGVVGEDVMGTFSKEPLQYAYLSLDSGGEEYKITVLDENLNLVKNLYFGKIVYGLWFSETFYLYLDDESFVLAGFARTILSTFSSMLVAKFDHDGNLVSYSKKYDVAGSSYDRMGSLDLDNNGDIIVTRTRKDSGAFSTVVTCHDRNDLSVNWEKSVTGYPSNGLDIIYKTVTLDNGTTAILDWGGDSVKVMFVDQTYSVDENGIGTNPFPAYPNPAANTLHLEISPDVTVGSVSLYDVSGRLAKTQTTGFETVDISGFAPWVYLMKVTLENGKVFEEKIVKQ